ncbi:uncharacterized protein LOC119691291 isoform X1 [Plutella xylostella]|uniref:uncharacterized protein LOC119691291 isoform X1 n=1 Tax=Plutella xylostella TaxID=51655 RepID=UPI0020327BFE|nr:uncharacterized protein LOC119691291 isoform X1 [Plutella xylostella]
MCVVSYTLHSFIISVPKMKQQYQTENRLGWLYGLLALLLAVCVICIGVPYYHWRTALRQCPGFYTVKTCGCILYGEVKYRHFGGSYDWVCHYAVFAPLPLIPYAVIMALFHMYRVCTNKVGQYENKNTRNMKEIISEKNDGAIHLVQSKAIHCWVPSTVVACIFAIYNFVHASILTDGYLTTCNQYRGYLATKFDESGDYATAIHFRLTCQAIFDFIDYIEKDPYVEDQSTVDIIHTGLALQSAIITAWLAVALWIIVAITPKASTMSPCVCLVSVVCLQCRKETFE